MEVNCVTNGATGDPCDLVVRDTQTGGVAAPAVAGLDVCPTCGAKVCPHCGRALLEERVVRPWSPWRYPWEDQWRWPEITWICGETWGEHPGSRTLTWS